MQEVLLIKNGELYLKGLNRNTFEDALVRNIKRRLADLTTPVCGFGIRKAQSTIYIEPFGDIDVSQAFERVLKVFGIASASRSAVCEKNFDTILALAGDYLTDELNAVKTFKVEAKRADKTFPLNSPQICTQLGEKLLQQFPHLTVDVHNPQCTVMVEIRDYGAYIHANQQKGAGGMPVGTSGRAAIMLSGGIDSPVAAYMMAKRGLQLTAIHFASPPYTSERALRKVEELCKKVEEYAGNIKLLTVNLTALQEAIHRFCPDDMTTLILRRYMMRIASQIAKKHGCDAVITGESLGQVASQTIHALGVTESASELPVFRPLIGMDKEEIVQIARKIDTFETSILPYEDCCTVFTPRHPRTRPTLEMAIEAEKVLENSFDVGSFMADLETQ